MKVWFWINGEEQSGNLGLVEGYIQEGINEVSLLELILVSSEPIVVDDCKKMVGSTFTLMFADRLVDKLQMSRFDGLIFEFHSLDTVAIDKDLFMYQMIVRPQIWRANYHVNAAAFPNISKPDAVKMVFESWGMGKDTDFDITLALPDEFLKHKQILQNQASDLVFIQNLLKESGINYYFGTDDKDGKGREKIKLTNYFNYKKQSWDDIIPYNPHGGHVAGGDDASRYRLTSFETHYRASTSAVDSTAKLGDGLTTVRHTNMRVEDGKYAQFKHFTADGENVQDNIFLQKNDTVSRKEFHKISQMIFEGRSNYYLFRSGEVYKMEDTAGACTRPVLITHCFHHFRQTVNSALSAENNMSSGDHVDYTNVFSGVDGDIDTNNALNYRPDQTWGKTTVELRRMFSARHSVPRDERDTPRYDIDELERYNLKRKIAALEAELSVAKELSGLLVGTVTKDAWVTQNPDTGAYNNELVCQVTCDRFPEEIIIKIALGWLTQQGWLSLLPRVGTQVYFQFINGAGGQNEAVLVGYRPTGDMPIHDPAKTTTSTKLGAGDAPELGKPADKVVGKGEFAPKNKFRQALLGEGAVAEVAVIDGGEDTVYLHANNRICAIGDKAVNISTASLCESAGGASQQFGSLSRGVKNDQKVSIGANCELSVGGYDKIDVVGNYDTKVHANRKLEVTGTSTEDTKGKVSVTSDNSIHHISGDSTVVITKNDHVVLRKGNNIFGATADQIAANYEGGVAGWKVESSGVTIKSDPSTITVEKSGNIIATAPHTKIEGKTDLLLTGKSTKLVGTSEVKIDGGIITLTGSLIKLNA